MASKKAAPSGHFGGTCYHPVFVFNQLGDVERCACDLITSIALIVGA
jgi:hypothetical protein